MLCWVTGCTSVFLVVVLEFIGFPCGSDGKESAHNSADLSSLGGEDPLEKKMATHSSILAWEIPWTGEPGRLQSTGSQKRTRLSD